jgi:acyl carrier protein
MGDPAVTAADIKQEFLAALRRIAPEIEPESLDPEEPIRDQADIDSIDFLNLVIRLCEQYRIEIPESDYAKLQTVNGAVDYLAQKCAR